MIKNALRAVLTAFQIMVLGSFCAANAQGFEDNFGGAWQGTLRYLTPTIESPALPNIQGQLSSAEVAIEFSENSTQVFIKQGNSWLEVKPGAFGRSIHETNAVVASIDSAFSADGQTGWVETWNFTLTQKDQNSLYAYWIRNVNNPHLEDGAHPDARVYLSGFITLNRSETPITSTNALRLTKELDAVFCTITGAALCGGLPDHSTQTQHSDKITQD